MAAGTLGPLAVRTEHRPWRRFAPELCPLGAAGRMRQMETTPWIWRQRWRRAFVTYTWRSFVCKAMQSFATLAKRLPPPFLAVPTRRQSCSARGGRCGRRNSSRSRASQGIARQDQSTRPCTSARGRKPSVLSGRCVRTAHKHRTRSLPTSTASRWHTVCMELHPQFIRPPDSKLTGGARSMGINAIWTPSTRRRNSSRRIRTCCRKSFADC
mmetsp:Transcript_31088/g.85124  ORF Transcript_31088/g.85124 Transcript_31088/m.85124 type:complete len:212 (+) Transcript_31088:126-761(+)